MILPPAGLKLVKKCSEGQPLSTCINVLGKILDVFILRHW